MKILLFSDLHCHSHAPYSTRTSSGLNSRFLSCLNVVSQACEICQEENVGTAVFCGDLFHGRTKLDIDVFSETWKAFRKLSDNVSKLIMLVGNHDQHRLIGDVHSVYAFSAFADVVDSPKTSVIDDVVMHLLPYMHDKNDVVQSLNKMLKSAESKDKKTLAFLHQSIFDALPDHKIKGDEVLLSELPVGVDKYFSGHIHTRQSLANDRFYYLGSALQHTFGERDQDKGFTLYDTTTGACSFVRSNSPRFFRFDVTEDTTPRKSMDFSGVDFSSDFVKICYSSKWKTEVEKIKEEHPRIVLEAIPENYSSGCAVSQELLGNDEELLKSFVAESDTGDLDEEKLLQYGLEILASN